MQRTTLGSLRDTSLPHALNLCSTDLRLARYVNESQKILLAEGTWWGTYARYKCEAIEGLLVWPRQIAAILAASVCDSPMKTRDMFHEFVELGMGLLSDETYITELIDRGTSPLFSAITGTTKLVKVYCDLAADVGTSVLLLGYDENQNWVRTQQGGVWLDGEIVLASLAGTLSTKIFSVITAVQKAETSGPIRLYEYDPATATQRAIARYDYDETNPSYRVSYIPSLDTDASVDEPVTVEIVAKLDFIPAKRDTDYLLIGNEAALKAMCSAIITAENEPLQENKHKTLASGIALAKMFLDAEARHYLGNPQRHLSVTGSAGIDGDPIAVLI